MTRQVYLTSFQRSRALPPGVLPVSCAVYQPKGYAYPKADWTDIRRDGEWTRPRDFVMNESGHHPLVLYRDALYRLYRSRLAEAEAWAGSLGSDVALCCWCPYDQAAQRQLREHGTFVCHTGVLAEFIERELDLRVWLDEDRRLMKALPVE